MTELSTNSIRILDIKYGTSVDGIGLRTSLYCAGCENHCVGCHNPQSWDEYGGDPMFHPEGFIQLAQMIKEQTDKTIWCYTGYRFEDLLAHPLRRKLVELCDVIVDGRYIEAERDLSLHFRGSRNQRLIDVPNSLRFNKVYLIE